MTKIEQIQDAIAKAEKFQSKLSSEALNVPFLGSLKIRALLNNLGELATHVLEIGSHKSGSLCSTIYKNDNIKSITAIDSWESDETNEDKAYPQFIENTQRFKPANSELNVIVGNCWDVSLTSIKHPVDFYNYDAGHSESDQCRALTYYYPVLADEFIYVCDDWQYGDVKRGTMDGLAESGLEIIHQWELLNTEPYNQEEHRNMEWWRGYAIFLLKKK